MTLTIELTPAEERCIQNAQARGSDITMMIKGLLAGLPEAPEPETSEDRTLALLAQWRAEDTTDDPEELARRDAELVEFKANLNANRAATGEEPLFP
jgi:hypothetical protein